MEPSDTSPEAEAFLLEGFRRMSPTDKLRRVASLNGRWRSSHPRESGRSAARYRRRRCGSASGPCVWGRETMVKVFGWDPEVEGW